MAAGLDEWAADNLLTYLREQREATGHVPDDRTIVVERFRDELGDWRIAVHSPFGAQVHAPWALALSARMRDRFGVDVQAMHGDDGIVLRLPDLEWDDVEGIDRRSVGRELLDLVTIDPDEIRALVTEEIGGSALFASRFRECAARALLLPRRQPGPPAAAVAAAPAGLPAARGRQPLPDLPHRPRGRPRVRPGRLRRAGPRRPHARRRRARKVTVVDVESHHAVALRQVPALRVRRAVPLRGRHPARRASGRGAGPRPLAARGAPRRVGGARAARPPRRRAGRPHRGRAAAPHAGARGPRRRRRPRPAAGARPALGGGGAPALPRGCHRRRRRGLARRARVGAAGHPGARRRRGAVGGHRGRLPPARRARGVAAARGPADLPRTGRRPARRPRRPVRPHPRALPHRRGRPGVRHRRRRRRHGARPARLDRPGRRGRAAAHRRGVHRVLRRRGAADAAAPLPRRAARGGRAGHARGASAGSSASGRASAAGSAAATASSAPSSS